MIKISQLRNPLTNDFISFDQFRFVYRKQLFSNPKGKQIHKILFSSINQSQFYGFPLNSCQQNCLIFLLKYNNVILYGNVTNLEKIIEKMKDLGYQSLIHDGIKTTPFGEKILSLYNYTSWFRSKQERGVWFAKCFSLKTCPYCNSQYTLTITKKKSNLKKVKFQFDHFYPKEKYPYLALSLYNLIPSCSSCNHNKSSINITSKTGYHPYQNSLSEIAEFYLKYPAEFEKMTLEGVRKLDVDKELEIIFQPKTTILNEITTVNNHDEMFDITEIYNLHKDIAHQMLISAKLNDKSYQKSIMPIKGLFSDNEALLKYILNTSLSSDEILKSAFTKFKQDIAKQLGLID